MTRRAPSDRRPFVAGLCDILDLFGDRYRRSDPYPHPSEQAALIEDWLAIAGDLRVAVDRFGDQVDRGELPLQRPLFTDGERERA